MTDCKIEVTKVGKLEIMVVIKLKDHLNRYFTVRISGAGIDADRHRPMGLTETLACGLLVGGERC